MIIVKSHLLIKRNLDKTKKRVKDNVNTQGSDINTVKWFDVREGMPDGDISSPL